MTPFGRRFQVELPPSRTHQCKNVFPSMISKAISFTVPLNDEECEVIKRSTLIMNSDEDVVLVLYELLTAFRAPQSRSDIAPVFPARAAGAF